MRCFTSSVMNYLPKARILAESVKRHHPEWTMDVVLCEPKPLWIDPPTEPFDNIVEAESLGIPNFKSWMFKHTVVEACTGVKGFALNRYLGELGEQKVLYLDPDIVVFNPLTKIEELLDRHPLVLTPHQLSPEEELDVIVDNEICSLKHGVYNLGFVAARAEGQGKAFASWWRDRLHHFCYDDIPNGLFTDQRWGDLVPVFFDQVHILRSPEFNVATWNLTNRKLTMDGSGRLLVNGMPLRFYHFTGYDSGAGATMLRKYGGDDRLLCEVWDWYARELERKGQQELGGLPWTYGVFQNGEPVHPEMRSLYRRRRDLQDAFPDPLCTSQSDGGFLAWWKYTDDKVAECG